MAERPTTPEALYPMRVVTRLTGLPANTIRVWERRYQAIAPRRTGGNARRYSADDVRKLQLLRDLTSRGHRIGDVAARTIRELEQIVEARVETEASARAGDAADGGAAFAGLRGRYLAAIERFDHRAAHEELALTAALLSPDRFVFEVFVPLAREVGSRWAAGTLTVAHEHLISAQLRSLVPALTRRGAPLPGTGRVVITAPEGHLHELGLLAGTFLAAGRGFECLYLGPDMPEPDLLHAVRTSGAELVVLSVARDVSGAELRVLGETLRRLSAVADVWIGCPPGHALTELECDVRTFHSYEDFDAALVDRASRAPR